MIVYPKEWRRVGEPVNIEDIEKAIKEIISEIDCNCLALSGGVDSSLLLYFILQVRQGPIEVFTIGLSDEHPDIKYSRMIVEQFNKIYGRIQHNIFIPSKQQIKIKTSLEDFKGDEAVGMFFNYVEKYTDKIIAGDGIDEYMCGYYDHQKSLTEDVYYDYMRRLQKEQLVPLDKNSGNIKVYLPYIDDRLIFLLSQIPLKEKVDGGCRKKLMVTMGRRVGICEEIIERWKYGFCNALEIK